MAQHARELPDKDLELAATKKFTFSACEKTKQGGPWIEVLRTQELAQAFTHAQNRSAFETGVFIETTSGGYLYWSSRNPKTFNSTVLEEGFSP